MMWSEQEVIENLKKDWHKQCPKCLCYYKWEHWSCDWFMAALVAMWRANWKIVTFIHSTPPKT
jgi:hypothetical protein